jgi:hypothetical protein
VLADAQQRGQRALGQAGPAPQQQELAAQAGAGVASEVASIALSPAGSSAARASAGVREALQAQQLHACTPGPSAHRRSTVAPKQTLSDPKRPQPCRAEDPNRPPLTPRRVGPRLGYRSTGTAWG